MPPHLHPRSTATSTLFAGTLLASFTVVAIPHIFPCPRPRRAYADAERRQHLDTEETSSSNPTLRPKKRRKRPDEDRAGQNQNVGPSIDHPPYLIQAQAPASAGAVAVTAAPAASLPSPTEKPKDPLISDDAALFRQFQAEAALLDKEAHACPVPKPSGLLGRILGFQQQQKNSSVDEDKRDAAAKRQGR